MSNNEKNVAEGGEEIERIRTRIEKLVADHFKKGTSIYYFSQLGTDLGDDRKRLEHLSGVRLAQFIESRFEFEIGHTGTHQNVLYIRQPGAGKVELPSAAPQYKKRFWAAFAVPLQGDKSRFINLYTLKFGSGQDDVAIGGGEVRPIDHKYITVDGQYGTPAEIMGHIREWLAEQELDETSFIVHSRRTDTDDSESLLDALLNSLSGDQLKRVSLPLDVVKVLSDRRIG